MSGISKHSFLVTNDVIDEDGHMNDVFNTLALTVLRVIYDKVENSFKVILAYET